jgi:hypothetical protein
MFSKKTFADDSAWAGAATDSEANMVAQMKRCFIKALFRQMKERR